jgi:uncharacterized phage protein (TIGR02220 family)
MPTRLLREGILTSERVDALEPPAEVFYRRLMSKVDDFGLFDARPSILRASLYPLRVDRVREADIPRWLAACEKAGLILLYEANGKPYLKMLDTRWQVRSEAKFPVPPENSCKQVETVAPVVEVVVGDVSEVTPLSGKPDPSPPDRMNGHRATAREILEFLNEKTGKQYKPVDANLELIVARLREGFDPDDIRAVIAKKCREWGGDDKMGDYLRPKTLFGRTNFANYEGELGTPAGLQ